MLEIHHIVLVVIGVLEGDRVVHTEKLAEGIGRVRNVVMGPDGLVYIGLEEPGMIVRLVPVE